MPQPTNQFKTIEEKLRYYDKPFIEISLLQKIINNFAPKYRIDTLCTRWLLSPIVRWKLYLNLLSTKKAWLLATTILAKYGEWKTYAVWWIYLYNKYNFSDQLANQITVYNTSIHGQRIIAWFKFIFYKVRLSFFRDIKTENAQWYGKYKRMSKERALIQLITDTNGKMEYKSDIYNQIKTWKVSKQKLLSLSKKHTSKRVQLLIQQFIAEWQI